MSAVPARNVERAGALTSRLMSRLLLWMLRDFAVGRLDIEWPDGSVSRLDGAQPGPHGVLRVHSARLLARVLAGGEVGFGESYMAGHWDSPDLSALLQVLYRNEQRVRGPYERNALARLWGLVRHRARRNTRRGARRNIEYHYDLGNDFYARWLDPGMVYSSAVFASPEQSLHDAQRHKFDLLCDRLELGPDRHLLEIGCGWGGFAIHAAQRSGCRVTGITLSHEQLREAERRAAAAGLGDRVKFRLQDYRDLGDGTFDRVASIEMYEAVGEAYWPTYFETIARVLAPGGIAALQGITIDPAIFDAYRGKRDFIQKYIFPGGMLSTPARFTSLAVNAGLDPQAPAFFAADYARTLACWHRGVLEHETAIEREYGRRFLRMWRYYLAYCECGFSTGSIDLMHLTLRKPVTA
ncbi:MAG TPA: cyclopropane-fatty-acyl-phospholipid synthase family protein [Solimonas sp.]|nr:cyclopropane-fatty-acyl-phospholipid synthase family protein [Solimonas sp.]